MKEVFDLLEAINESTMAFVEENGRKPEEVAVSIGAHRRLLEIKAGDTMIGNLVIGCTPLDEIETDAGTVRLAIDETLAETEIVVS